MTYCVGWKYKNSAYLVADSVVSGIQVASQQSSFGEASGPAVEEATLKLAVIGPGVAVTYSGGVYTASRVINFLKRNFNPNASPEAAFECVKTCAGPFNQLSRFLMARSYPDRSPSLTYWDTYGQEADEIEDYFELGSLPENGPHRSATSQMLQIFREEQTDEAAMLCRVISGIQSYGQHENMLNFGVGGIIWGLRVSDRHVHWQPTTTYLIDSVAPPRTDFVMAFMRDDWLLVQSSYTKTLRAFPFRLITENSVSLTMPDSVKDALAIGPFHDWDQWLCLVHLKRSERGVVTVYRNSTHQKEVAIVRVPGKGSIVQMRRGSLFAKALKEPIPPEKMGMRFIFERSH